MKSCRLFVVILLAFSFLTLVSCSESESYETGSGTASRNEAEESTGLTVGGDINDASEWGPVIGIN